eukprot:9907162-Alexandrium_andersonii.AAC.1
MSASLVGSEMCIRDRCSPARASTSTWRPPPGERGGATWGPRAEPRFEQWWEWSSGPTQN